MARTEELFGTDGIRATVGEWPLVPDFVLQLGQALGAILRASEPGASVVIGRDTRESGPALQSALTAGLLSSDLDVIDVGVITTPGVAVLTRKLNASAGIVLSASHNPFEQNGIKCFTRTGQKLPPETEAEIERLAKGPTPAASRMKGRLLDGTQFHEAYVRELLGEHPVEFLKGVSIVVDCGNGAASRLGPEVLSRAGARVHAIHASPTGTNINVHSGSEHVRRKPSEMSDLIRQVGADFGVAFDGDADRVVFLDERGGLVDGDHMLGVFARYLQAKGTLLAGTLVTTNMRNTGLKNYVSSAGIKLEETPVGDKYVIERLMELRRATAEKGMLGLGGEQAGHLILLDEDHLTGDGIRTALHFASVFQQSGSSSMADFAAGVGKTPQIIASASVAEGPRRSKAELAELEEETLREIPGIVRVNLRYSGTEALFRIMLESDGRQTAEELGNIAVKLCCKVQSRERLLPGTSIDILNCTSGGAQTVSG